MDKIFKIGLLVLGFAYLAYLFCPVTKVGRYQSHKGDKVTYILDTATADVYSLYIGEWYKSNPLTETKPRKSIMERVDETLRNRNK